MHPENAPGIGADNTDRPCTFFPPWRCTTHARGFVVQLDLPVRLFEVELCGSKNPKIMCPCHPFEFEIFLGIPRQIQNSTFSAFYRSSSGRYENTAPWFSTLVVLCTTNARPQQNGITE